MPAHRYVEENGLAAMLTTKMSAGVAPEVNLKKCVAWMPLPRVNKPAHSGFETQRRHHQKSKCVNTLSIKRQRQIGSLGPLYHCDAPRDPWKLGGVDFGASQCIPMGHCLPLPLPLMLDALLDTRCGYSLKQGYQWPHKRIYVLQKFIKKNCCTFSMKTFGFFFRNFQQKY